MSESEQTTPQAEAFVKWPSLAHALHAIMCECGYIQKSKADKLNYRVLNERQVNEEIRPLMLKHGVLVLPHSIEKLLEVQYEVPGYGGKPPTTWYRQQFRYLFKFRHVHSDEFELVPAIGEACSNADKGSNSCVTIAEKYAIKTALYLLTGDDPDLVPAEEAQGRVQPATQQPKAQAAATTKAPAEKAAVPKNNPNLVKLLADTLKQYNPDYTLANAMRVIEFWAGKKKLPVPARVEDAPDDLLRATIDAYVAKIAEMKAKEQAQDQMPASQEEEPPPPPAGE